MACGSDRAFLTGGLPPTIMDLRKQKGRFVMKLCIISRSGQLETMKHCAELYDFIGG